MTSLLNFIKIYQLVQKLLRGDTQTDRQDGDLISLTFLFKESRLIMVLFLVNSLQVDIRALVSLQSCGGQKVTSHPLCLHQDHSWMRQGIVRDDISHTYKTTGRIIVLYTLISSFLESKCHDNFQTK
jgi:hypothetical protein